jgi:hypothetical protein
VQTEFNNTFCGPLMKKIIVSFLALFCFNILANEVYTIHYLGDTKPMTIEVPIIVNKDGNNLFKSKSKITLIFDEASTKGLNADFHIKIENKVLSIEATSINKSIIKVESTSNDASNFIGKVSFIPSETILAPLSNGITEPILKNDLLSFYTGKLTGSKLYKLKLLIVQKKFLKKDEEVLNKELTEEEMTLENISETKNLVTIDLKKITNGNFIASRKNEITVTLSSTFNFLNVVNLNQLGPVSFIKSKTFQETK